MFEKKSILKSILWSLAFFAMDLHAADIEGSIVASKTQDVQKKNLDCKNIKSRGPVLIEAKAAYFRPTNDKFRKIYSGGAIYGGEISCRIWRGIYAWSSGSYFHKKGSSIGNGDSTKITFVPVGLGLEYLWPVNIIDFYLGGGALGTYVHIEDNSPYVIHKTSKWGVGGIAKAGLLLNVTRHFFFDVFSDYSFMKVDFHNSDHGKVVPHKADLSGWSVGGGIGCRF